MSCIAVNEEIIAVTKGLYIDCYDYANHKIISIGNNELQKDDRICDIIISFDGKYLAVITSSSKKLIIYSLPTLKEERIYTLSRSASKIRFTEDNSQILVADKTGDCFIYDITTGGSGTKLLGHLSLLLNILQSKDGKYIITSDRDEKIRVTCYPNTYLIKTYCLGHKEFVNHIELLPHNVNYLVSTSGDGTIKCWNYEKGHLCHTIDVNLDVGDVDLHKEFKKIMDEEGAEVQHLPIVHLSIVKMKNSTSLIAVCVYLVKKILIYKLQSDDTKITHELVHTLDMDDFPNAIQFHNFLLFVCFSNEVSEYKITTKNDQITIDFNKKIDIFNNVDMCSSVVTYDPNLIKVLYKRKYDNVQEYQERKKRRLGIVE